MFDDLLEQNLAPKRRRIADHGGVNPERPAFHVPLLGHEPLVVPRLGRAPMLEGQIRAAAAIAWHFWKKLAVNRRDNFVLLVENSITVSGWITLAALCETSRSP